MKFHEKIRFMRQSKNWSQEDMANKLGMSVAGYAKIEQGRTDTNFSKLEQIASVFELDVVELLSFGEKNVIWATNLSRGTEQQNDSPSTKKSVIPAGRAKRGLAGIQLPWMAITKHTIDL